MVALEHTAKRLTETPLVPIPFEGTVGPDTVDSVLAKSLAGAEPDNWPLGIEFNFSEVEFILPVALQMVLAWMVRLKRMGVTIVVRIPRKQKVRDFLRVWGFSKAVQKALGTGFSTLVPREDLRYFGESQQFYLSARVPGHPAFSEDDTRASNFFGFHTLDLSTPVVSHKSAYDEKDYWNASHIQRVLERKLQASSKYFASRIVFEAVLNALRHPEASMVQTASFDQDLADSSPGSSFFTAHFWDDGVSMIDTLSRAINNGVTVRGTYNPVLDRKYLLIYSDDGAGQGGTSTIERSDCSLEAPVQPYRVLFATIFPCVSSDPLGKTHEVLPEIVQENPMFASPGMGLYVLVNAVVEVLNGTVAFRTGRYFMNVSKLKPAEARQHEEHGVNLRVRIKRRLGPEFLGNLVVVRLPAISTESAGQ